MRGLMNDQVLNLKGNCHLSDVFPNGKNGRREKDSRSSATPPPDYYKKIFLAPGFNRRLSNLPVRPVALLRYLIGKWKYHYLTWGEREILESLLGRLKRLPGCSELLQLIGQVRFYPQLNDWFQLNQSKLRGFQLQQLEFGAFYHHQSRCLVPSFRNWKGLRIRWVHLDYLLTKEPQQTGKLNVRRNRKRGHTDHGSLPANPIARRADSEGGQLLNEKAFEEQEDSHPGFFRKYNLDPRHWFQKWPSSWFGSRR